MNLNLDFGAILDKLFSLTGVSPVKVHRLVVAAILVLSAAVAALNLIAQNTPAK